MKELMTRLFGLLVMLSVLVLPACEDARDIDALDTDTDTVAQDQDTLQTAVAQLEPTEGNDARGTVTFTAGPEGVRVEAAITGLSEGQHGFHVHENGDCSAPDASSAGAHFAPQGSPHGAPTDPADQRHAGDLGNIEADASGSANYEHVDEQLSLSGANSIIGRAVVVHADPDDLESQPSGDAGARIACGVIRSDAGESGP